MKRNLLLILTVKMVLNVSAQKIGIEQYFSYASSLSQVDHSTLFFTQHPRNLITEIRYNYDAKNVFSFNAGRAFEFVNKKISTTMKPMIGIAAGSTVGINLNLDDEVEMNKLYVSSKLQYFFALQDEDRSFFYAWLESGISFSKKVYSGISFQMNLANKPSCDISKGFVLGFSSGRWSIPVYIFNPLDRQKNLIVGILYDISFQKRSQDISMTKQ